MVESHVLYCRFVIGAPFRFNKLINPIFSCFHMNNLLLKHTSHNILGEICKIKSYTLAGFYISLMDGLYYGTTQFVFHLSAPFDLDKTGLKML